MNNWYKNKMNQFQVSDLVESKIKEKCFSKNKNYFKLRYASIVILLLVVSFTIVYAEEIGNFIKSWHTSVQFEDGSKESITEDAMFKKIPANLDFSKEGMTIEEVEKLLDFKILKINHPAKNEVYLHPFLNKNGTVGRLDIWWARFVDENEKKLISMRMDMLIENADRGYVSAFQSSEGIDATGEKVLEETYISNNLDVKVIIYFNEESSERLTAVFSYDNILYTLIGQNYSQQEIKDIIEKLSF